MNRNFFFLFFLLVLPFRSVCEEDTGWLEKVSKNIDEEAVQWVRQQIAVIKPKMEQEQEIVVKELSTGKQCLKTTKTTEKEPSMFVFMSCSVPETLWVELSKEVVKANGIFILRGLPQNSFSSLAVNIMHLKEIGVEASIQVHPQLFETYGVKKVPTFLVTDGKNFDKISGNISLSFALEQIKEKGDTDK